MASTCLVTTVSTESHHNLGFNHGRLTINITQFFGWSWLGGRSDHVIYPCVMHLRWNVRYMAHTRETHSRVQWGTMWALIIVTIHTQQSGVGGVMLWLCSMMIIGLIKVFVLYTMEMVNKKWMVSARILHCVTMEPGTIHPHRQCTGHTENIHGC